MQPSSFSYVVLFVSTDSKVLNKQYCRQDGQLCPQGSFPNASCYKILLSVVQSFAELIFGSNIFTSDVIL